MPEQAQKLYAQMEPLIKRDFLRYSEKQTAQQQYRSIANPNHEHNKTDTPGVRYTSLIGARNFLISNTIALLPGQIQTLHTTPIVIIANPGPRSFIFVDGVAGRLTFGTAAYTGTNNLEFRYTNASGLKVAADMPASVFLNASANAYSYSPFTVDANRNTDYNFTPVGGDVGNNGQVIVTVPTANPATGNSSVTLTVYYRVVSFTT